MDRLIDFAGNHLLLSGLFVALLLALIVTEIMRLTGKSRMVGSAEAVRLINREDAAVIDVSSSNDYQKAHIIGAVHMPPSQIDTENPRLRKMRGRPVLVYCKNGQASWQVAGKLAAAGLEPVYVLRGGLNQWLQDKNPVERA